MHKSVFKRRAPIVNVLAVVVGGRVIVWNANEYMSLMCVSWTNPTRQFEMERRAISDACVWIAEFVGYLFAQMIAASTARITPGAAGFPLFRH